MAKVKFYRTASPSGSVEFTRPVSYGGENESLDFLQPSDRSDGNDWYIYNKGNQENIKTLNFTRMTEADYRALRAFLSTAAIGSSNSFTVIDPLGDIYTCFFQPQKFTFPLMAWNKRTGSLTLIVLSGSPEFHIVGDTEDDVTQREFLDSISDSFFELDANGDIMAQSAPAGVSSLIFLDACSNIQLDFQ